MSEYAKNVEEALWALENKPIKATSAERILILDRIKSDHKEKSQHARFAYTLKALLGEVSVPVKDHDLIAGRVVDRELSEDEERLFQQFIKHPDYPKRHCLLSSGHCDYSWDKIVALGIAGLRSIAESKLQDTPSSDTDKRAFWSAMIEIYDAISAYMLRYAQAAALKGLSETAKNLEIAATKAPCSFASALQLLWIITLIDCAYITPNPTLTVGRLDKILYPLYKKDIESGVLTRELAERYITDYFCKHNLIMGRGEHQVGDATNSTTFERICCFDAPQYLMLAGTDENGAPVVNELTYLFAESIVPRFKNPVIVVRYFKGMDRSHEKLWEILVDKAQKSSSLMFYNDDNMLKTLDRMGLPKEDAVKYSHYGCNWPSIGDISAWMSSDPVAITLGAPMTDDERRLLRLSFMRMPGECGWPQVFVESLEKLSAYAPERICIDELYSIFLQRMTEFIKTKLERLSLELTVRKRRPSGAMSFTDCFNIYSVESGESFSANAKYHFQLQSFYMFATVVDCFIAVDTQVMREKRFTCGELLDALRANFKGYERILALCRGADKYGMDTEISNYHAKRLCESFCEIILKENKPYFEKQRLMLVPCLQSDTWHLKCGEIYGATPDGRLAGAPFSQNSRPSNGSCVNGLTAMLNSMQSIPCDGILSGALNLDIDQKQFEAPEQKKIFAAILATYFNGGGLHAQVSAVSADDLIDAQKNPERHRDLRVRVTGYSGIFVDMCKKLQDDIIERFK